MKIKLTDNQSVPKASAKLALLVAAGAAAGLVCGFALNWDLAPLVAWDTAALTFIISTWRRVLKFDAAMVKRHATREDPSRVTSDIVLLAASVASLLAVGVLLVGQKVDGLTQAGYAAFGVISVVSSWLLVHTIFALRYAENYYSSPEGGVEFGSTTAPTYTDFAYLAFTVGMTYQVSDTLLTKRKFRANVLRQALLSFVFGTIIIATTINLVAGLGK